MGIELCGIDPRRLLAAFAAVLATALLVTTISVSTAGAIQLPPIEEPAPGPPGNEEPAPEPAPAQPAPGSQPAATPGGADSAESGTPAGRSGSRRRPSTGADAPVADATDPATSAEPASQRSLPVRLLTPVRPARSAPSISIPTPEPFGSVLAIAVLLLMAAAAGTTWAQVVERSRVLDEINLTA